MTAYTPPPEAVEVAARAVHARRCPRFADEGQCAHPLDGTQMLTALGDANAALTAAVPLIERAMGERVAEGIERLGDSLTDDPDRAVLELLIEDAARVAREEANHG